MRADIARHALLRPDRPVLVGLSGGADSVALLAALQRAGYRVEAAHCNFHLRGEESERDAAFAEALCRRRGVALHRADFDTARSARQADASIEMQARAERYGFFRQLLAGSALQAVAVAHHRDDNVETMLLNLLRGTGLSGLTGMPRRNGDVVRPLLGFSRADILAFLRDEGESYVTDSTNADTAFRRNKVRHELLPLMRAFNPSVDAALAETIARLEEAEALARPALASWEEKLTTRLLDGFSLEVGALLSSPAPRTLLFDLLRPIGFTPGACSDLFSGLCGRTGAWREGGDYVALLDRGRMEVRRRPVRFSPQPLPREGEATLPDGSRMSVRELPIEQLGPLPRRNDTACLDADTLCGPLFCRSAAEGDRFTPFGMKGTKLVSDYLTDRKRTRIDKLAARVVTDGKGIVWLAGERPDARCAVTERTRNVKLIALTPRP